MKKRNNAPTGRPRSPRRPGPSGTLDIRERILNTAEFLFATRGFSATSVREIAERVDVNAAMVHYYFGSKKRLLQAVMDGVLGPMAETLASLQQRGRIEIPDLTRLLFSMAAAHPYLPQLITREVFLSGGDLQQEFLQHFAPRLGGRLPGILRREQEGGRLMAGLDPNIMALLILSLCFFPLIARSAAEPILGIAYDAEGLRVLAEHVTGLLERGLVP
jgi:AcrR family transcriptional regulator